MNDSQYSYFEGALYDTAPLNAPLSPLVLLHNLLIFLDYHQARDPDQALASFLLQGVALADIFTAQGHLLLSVVSVCVYKGALGREVLYKSLYYYNTTALPGLSVSRLLHVVLSVNLCLAMVQPYRLRNEESVKSFVKGMVGFIVLLHLSDVISAMTADLHYGIVRYKPSFYVTLLLFFEVPGLVTTVIAVCVSTGLDDIEKSPCMRYLHGDMSVWLTLIMAVQFFINFVIPPVIIFVCMVVQVVVLKRKTYSANHAALLVPLHHAATTILIVSLSFLVCHMTYISLLLYIVSRFGSLSSRDVKMAFRAQGVLVGLSELTLPLLYSAMYPLILVARKPALRMRYGRVFKVVSKFVRRTIR